MAKIMLVRCSPTVVSFIQSKRSLHTIVADDDGKAIRVLEQTFPDLLPDLTLLGNSPPLGLGKTQTKRAMVEWAGRLERRFPRARFVLLNGEILPRRAPKSVAGVCSGSPQVVYETILRILSPGS